MVFIPQCAKLRETTPGLSEKSAGVAPFRFRAWLGTLNRRWLVAQTFQSAVSPTFQSARLGKERDMPKFEGRSFFGPFAGWKTGDTAG